MYTIGLGYFPSPPYTMPFPHPPPAPLYQQMSPPHTPPRQANDSSQNLAQVPPVQMPAFNQHWRSESLTSPTQEVLLSHEEPPSSSTRKSSPKIVGQKFEDGVLKIVYDQGDLRRYREANGLPEPEREATEDSKTVLPLLPVSSGGHDEMPSEIEGAPVAEPIQLPTVTPPTYPRVVRSSSSADRYRPTSEVKLVPVPVPFSPPGLTPHFQDRASRHGDTFRGPPSRRDSRNLHNQPNPYHQPGPPPPRRPFRVDITERLHPARAELEHANAAQTYGAGPDGGERYSAHAEEARMGLTTDEWVAESGSW